MAAGGSSTPPLPPPQITSVGGGRRYRGGSRRRGGPPRCRRRHRLTPPDFFVHRTPDDLLLLLPAGGGIWGGKPHYSPQKKRKKRRREEEEEGGEGGEEGEEGASSSPWGTLLPPEILSRIFQAAAGEDGAVPVLCRVSRVCRLWSRVAADPRLWVRVALGGCWGAPPPPRPSPKAQNRVLSTLRWLAESRFSLLQEFELRGWKSHVGSVLQALAQHCPLLVSLALTDCGGVPAEPLAQLPPNCPQLQSLQLQHCQVDPPALLSFLAAAGPNLRQLRLSCGPRLGPPLLPVLASGLCPELRLLELDTGLAGTCPPLALPVEKLQEACPELQVLRLLNVPLVPRSGPPGGHTGPGASSSGHPGASAGARGQPGAAGFPQLLELSLAGPGGVGVTDGLLLRLLHGSGCLRLLDLRGCARPSPPALLSLPCHALEQLYLGLPCGVERAPRLATGSASLARRWHRSLRELDLSGRSFEPGDLAQAMATFGPSSPLRSLNLAGTKVTADALSVLLGTCPDLAYLNLSSCRWLPRGTKRPHVGQDEVRSCLQLLAQQTQGDQEPQSDQEPCGHQEHHGD